MARRGKAVFQATVNADFPTNGVGGIGAVKVRQSLGADVPDSFVNNVDDLQLLTSTTGANAYALTGLITAYTSGFMAVIKINTTSTGACTLNVNGKGAKKIYKDQATQANSGDLVANQMYVVIYDSALDGAAGGFLIMGYAASGVSSRVDVDTSGAAGVMDMASQPYRSFVGTVPIAGAIELSFDNEDQLIEAETFLEVTGATRLITIPANVLRDPSLWVWTKPATKLIWHADPGTYRLEWKSDGTNIHLDIYGGYTSTL